MKRIITIAIVLALFPGCVEVADDELGVAELALTGTALQSWTCPGRYVEYGGCTFDLGLVAGRACFLAGVRGSLDHADVVIYQHDGRWQLEVFPNGTTLSAATVCVSPATNMTPIQHWASSSGTSVNLGSGPSRRCFLTRIAAMTGMDQADDHVRVWKALDGTWYLGGNQHGESAWAAAACIDATPVAVVGASAPPNQITTVTLADNPGGVGCALQRISGSFVPAGTGDGAWIDYVASLTDWTLTVSNGKGAIAECFQ
jgi:hypothetical protein